jgi:hypothetical protein
MCSTCGCAEAWLTQSSTKLTGRVATRTIKRTARRRRRSQQAQRAGETLPLPPAEPAAGAPPAAHGTQNDLSTAPRGHCMATRLPPPPLRRRRCCCCRCRCCRWPVEAPIDVEQWAAAPRHKYQPQTHDCRTVRVWDPRRPHPPARHNPSLASNHGREQPQHAIHRRSGLPSRPSSTSRAEASSIIAESRTRSLKWRVQMFSAQRRDMQTSWAER